MKKKFDFILDEDEYGKTIFRFYPRKSHYHGFDSNLPKEWSEVYKIYFYYKIIWQGKDKTDKDILFDSGCDECSCLREVGEYCCADKKGCNTYAFTPLGTGVDWSIKELPTNLTPRLAEDYHLYEFRLFCYDGRGYRFSLSQQQIPEFGKFLTCCCDYMLKHGEPI